MSAKPLRYSERVIVMLSPEQMEELKKIAEETGDTVSGMLRRLAIQLISEHKK